jgi:hypothetical protein
MLRIYADFNCQDEQGRVLLNTVGSLRDIEAQKNELIAGLKVMLYVTDDFEVEGTLVFEQVWRAVPDLSTIRYYDESIT